MSVSAVSTSCAPAAPQISPAELAELMAAFNVVTGRLEQTHEALRQEVARLERQLRDANEELQRSKRLAALGEMAAGIAHEVRNPLGAIVLNARMLEQDLAALPEQKVMASKIVTAVRGLDAIVGDVLSFARETKTSVQLVDLRAVLERAVEASWVERCSARVCIVLDDASTEHVHLDADLMHRALVNLLRNARQAMLECDPPRDGHQLTVTGKASPDRSISIAISDTGPGVSPEVIERMFNPFFTTRATGTGLGLAIVHRIVDAHGGRVVVRSGVETRGATFEVILPHAGAACEINVDAQIQGSKLSRRVERTGCSDRLATDAAAARSAASRQEAAR